MDGENRSRNFFSSVEIARLGRSRAAAQKGLISTPKGKAKSLVLTGDSYIPAKELFEKHFAKIRIPPLKPS